MSMTKELDEIRKFLTSLSKNRLEDSIELSQCISNLDSQYFSMFETYILELQAKNPQQTMPIKIVFNMFTNPLDILSRQMISLFKEETIKGKYVVPIFHKGISIEGEYTFFRPPFSYEIDELTKRGFSKNSAKNARRLTKHERRVFELFGQVVYFERNKMQNKLSVYEFEEIPNTTKRLFIPKLVVDKKPNLQGLTLNPVKTKEINYCKLEEAIIEPKKGLSS